MDWPLFVTNVPADRLSIEQVALLYRVRWQVELVFKLWKSYCGLKHIVGLRRERVLVELYAKMIGLVLTHFLTAPLRMPHGRYANREISPLAVRRTFQRFARDLNCCLGHLASFQDVSPPGALRLQRKAQEETQHLPHSGFGFCHVQFGNPLG